MIERVEIKEIKDSKNTDARELGEWMNRYCNAVRSIHEFPPGADPKRARRSPQHSRIPVRVFIPRPLHDFLIRYATRKAGQPVSSVTFRGTDVLPREPK